MDKVRQYNSDKIQSDVILYHDDDDDDDNDDDDDDVDADATVDDDGDDDDERCHVEVDGLDLDGSINFNGTRNACSLFYFILFPAELVFRC